MLQVCTECNIFNATITTSTVARAVGLMITIIFFKKIIRNILKHYKFNKHIADYERLLFYWIIK